MCLACGAAFEAATVETPCPDCGDAPARLGGFCAFAPQLAHGGAGFEPHYFATLARLEAANFWFRARSDHILDALRTRTASFRSMLEIGCGTGYVLDGVHASFPDVALCGSDAFVEGLAFARTRVPAAFLLQMDATRIPFRDEFDVVGAFDVLEHIDDDERVLGEVRLALRAGGWLVATVPQHPSLWGPADELARHVRRYRRGELEGKLARAGFTVRHSTSLVSLLLPLLFVSRWWRRRRPELDPLTELAPPPLLNRLLYGVMRIELALGRLGLRFPVGGTRLVVAERSA
jgi:SAM-dependent methyltransferase